MFEENYYLDWVFCNCSNSFLATEWELHSLQQYFSLQLTRVGKRIWRDGDGDGDGDTSSSASSLPWFCLRGILACYNWKSAASSCFKQHAKHTIMFAILTCSGNPSMANHSISSCKASSGVVGVAALLLSAADELQVALPLRLLPILLILSHAPPPLNTALRRREVWRGE